MFMLNKLFESESESDIMWGYNYKVSIIVLYVVSTL